MNIFSSLASVLTGRKVDEDLDVGPTEAELRAERIKFHRERVRNGPVKFTQFTAGQIRRAEARAAKRNVERNFKASVRNHFETQRAGAYLRPHLQTIGLLPFIDLHEAPLDKQITSTAWIVQRYGVEVVNDGRGTGHASFRRGDVMDAIRNAVRFYEVATGFKIAIPSDFEPAIVLDESVA